MHPTAKAHRPCFVLRSHEGGYDLYANFGEDYDEEVHMGDFSTLPIAVDAFRAVENTVDTLLDLLAHKGALVVPPKVEPAFQPGESYLGEGHQMTAAEAAEAGRMGMAAVSGLDAATMRVPGVDDPDPAVHAAIREARARMARAAAQD